MVHNMLVDKMQWNWEKAQLMSDNLSAAHLDRNLNYAGIDSGKFILNVAWSFREVLLDSHRNAFILAGLDEGEQSPHIKQQHLHLP